MWQVPLSVIVAWIAGIQMDLDFKLIETGSLFVSVLVTAFTLQVHYYCSDSKTCTGFKQV
jgi:Ca2+:H+ antiporter